MVNVIFGDFRVRQLQSCVKEATEITNTYNFIFDDEADYLWFGGNKLRLFKSLSLTSTNIIIMLGFNDCVYSCMFNSFDLDSIINSYIETLDKLAADYQTTKFYFCSVNPIDCDYYNKGHINGVIPKEELLEKIIYFNTKIKEACEANEKIRFLDSFNYLIKTGFNTRDGIRLMSEANISLLYYLNSNMTRTGGSTFERRSTEDRRPVVTETGECDLYWKATKANGVEYGGLNRFNENANNIPNKSKPWDTLPNCTSYAWGRFYEISGVKPTLKGNACDWFDLDDNYERGQEPREGAIICWSGGSGAGHVAIVEEILPSGNIIISESGWQMSWYWRTNEISKDSNGKYKYGSSYTFQGFIYNPKFISGGVSGDYVDKSDVTAKAGSPVTGEAQQKNARYIWQYLGSEPNNWSLNAVAALLGNMQNESSINHMRFEGITGLSIVNEPTEDEIQEYLERYKSKKGRYPGFGLTQWTSKGISSWSDHKLISWCNSKNLNPYDIDSQLERIVYEAKNKKQWQKRSYEYKGENFSNITFSDFITSTKDPNWLAGAFAYCYEQPGSSDNVLSESEKKNGYSSVEATKLALCTARGKSAEQWYEYLLPFAPGWGITFAVSNFKIDILNSTNVQASFIVSKGKTGYYNLYDSNDKLIAKKVQLDVKTDEDTNDLSKIVTFTCNELVPNTKYKLEIVVESDSSSEEKTAEVQFITKQEYPKSKLDIIFKPEALALPDQKFNVTISGSTSFGYWSKNSHGYIISSIINGKIVKKITISKLNKNEEIIFKHHELFKDANINVGDIVQIGIDTWVKDDSDKELFDISGTTMSNAICLIDKSILTYLNNN